VNVKRVPTGWIIKEHSKVFGQKGVLFICYYCV
jgi:hypothetical protein